MTKQLPNLTGIPETMLWTLHNRAYEAMHPQAIIDDPKCIEIYQSLDYDYEKSFGKAEGSHGVRSFLFDNKIREFLSLYPNGVIVNLGEGLETQRYRINTDKILWISLDLPEGIAIRERFIQPDEYHKHLSMSALDSAWFNELPNDCPVFITAQGLFMYFTEEQLKQLFQLIKENISTVWIMFDHNPRWLSKKTMSEKGWQKTPYYTTPKMPWGINRDEIVPTLSDWLSVGVDEMEIEEVLYDFPRGINRYFMNIMRKLPVLKNKIPAISLIKLSS